MYRFGRPALALLVLAACYADETAAPAGDPNATTIELTDAPFPYDSVDRVDLYIVSIAVNTSPDTTATTGWVVVAEPRRRFNLIDLAGGVTDTLGGTLIPAGTYRAVRMVIDTDSSSVTARSSAAMPVAWQHSTGRPTLFALVESDIGVPDTGTSIVIDFDVGRSFLCDSPCASFTFSPVFRAVNRYATGAVSGWVAGDTLSPTPTPIPLTSVTVFTGDPGQPENSWAVRATGRTDDDGFFRIAFLMPGTYILRADAPRASSYTPGVRAGVIVTAGVEVPNQGIVLPVGP